MSFRKLLRFIVIFVAVLLLVFAGLIAYLYFNFPTETALNQVKRVLWSELKREIRVREVDVNVFKGFVLRDVKISRYGGFKYGTTLSAREVAIRYSILSLIQGNLDISSVKVRSADVSLFNRRDLKFPKKRGKKSGKSSGSSFLKISKIDADGRVKILGNYASFDLKIKQSSGKINVNLHSKWAGGRIFFNGDFGGGNIKVESLDLSKVADVPVKIGRMSGRIYLKDVLTLSDATANVITPYGKYNLKLNASLKGKVVRFAVLEKDKLNVSAFGRVVNGSVSLKASMTDTPIGVFLKGVDGTVNGKIVLSGLKRIKGNLSFKGRTGRVSFKGTAEFTGNRAFSLVKLESPYGNWRVKVGSVEIVPPKLLKVDAFCQKLGLMKVFQGEKKESGERNKKFELPEIPVPVAVNLSVGEVETGFANLRNVSVNGRMKGSEGSINGKFSALRGAVRFNSTLETHSAIFYLKGGELDLSGVRLKKGKIYGTASVEVSGNLMRWSEPDLRFSVFVKKGELRGFTSQKELSAFLKGVPLDDLFFESAVVEGELSGETLLIRRFDVSGQDFKTSIVKTFTVSDGSVSGEIKLWFNEQFMSSFPNPAFVFVNSHSKKVGNGREIVIKVGGKIDDPSFSL